MLGSLIALAGLGLGVYLQQYGVPKPVTERVLRWVIPDRWEGPSSLDTALDSLETSVTLVLAERDQLKAERDTLRIRAAGLERNLEEVAQAFWEARARLAVLERHAALDRAYRAHLLREGLTARTEHVPVQ